MSTGDKKKISSGVFEHLIIADKFIEAKLLKQPRIKFKVTNDDATQLPFCQCSGAPFDDGDILTTLQA